jgi:predicted PurR-regulated permease PerM
MTLQRQVLIWFALLGLVIYVLVTLSSVLLPFEAGLILGYLLDPLAERLERMGVNRLGATLVLLAMFVLLLVLILLMLVPILAHQFAALIENLPGFAIRLQQLATDEGGKLLESYGGETLRKLGLTNGLTPADMQNSIGSFVGQGSTYLIGVLKSLWSGGTALLSLVSLVIITPVVAFYILLDWKSMIAAIDGWVPLAHRDDVRQIARDIDAAFAGFVRGQSLVCMFLGLWYGIGLTLAGLNFGFLIGLTGGFLSFIPYAGSMAVLVFATAVALVQSWPDWPLVVMTLGVVISGQFLEGNILSPNLVGASVGLHPVWVMFALLAFGALFGFTGLIMAVPLAAATAVIMRFVLRKYLSSPLYTGEPDAGDKFPVPRPFRRDA